MKKKKKFTEEQVSVIFDILCNNLPADGIFQIKHLRYAVACYKIGLHNVGPPLPHY